jgi:hypothetical protein
VKENTILYAEKFLDALPAELRGADIIPLEVDGNLEFEWYRSPRNLISIEIDAAGHVAVCPFMPGYPHIPIEFEFTGEIPANVIEMIRAVVCAPKETPLADFDVCFQWNMQFEDPQHTWEPNPDACPEGCAAAECYAIAGINSGEFPEDYAKIAALPVEEREAAIQAFYRAKFWNQWLEQIDSNELAKRVYDSSVNQGPEVATKILQASLNVQFFHLPSLAVDGILGPYTVFAANKFSGTDLVQMFKTLRLDAYKKDRGWNEYKNDWTARALA